MAGLNAPIYLDTTLHLAMALERKGGEIMQATENNKDTVIKIIEQLNQEAHTIEDALRILRFTAEVIQATSSVRGVTYKPDIGFIAVP